MRILPSMSNWQRMLFSPIQSILVLLLLPTTSRADLLLPKNYISECDLSLLCQTPLQYFLRIFLPTWIIVTILFGVAAVVVGVREAMYRHNYRVASPQARDLKKITKSWFMTSIIIGVIIGFMVIYEAASVGFLKGNSLYP